MPKIEDIDQFKPLINTLGKEIENLAEQGLAIEDVLPPEPEIDSELSALLDSADDLDGPPINIDSPDDMDSLLNQFQKDVEDEEEETPETFPEEELPEPLDVSAAEEEESEIPVSSEDEQTDDFDISDLTEEALPEDSMDETPLPGEDLAEGEISSEEPENAFPDDADFSMEGIPGEEGEPPSEAGGDIEDFSFDDAEMLPEDFDEMDIPSESAADIDTDSTEQAPDIPESVPPSDEIEDLGDLDDLEDLGDIDEIPDMGDFQDLDIPAKQDDTNLPDIDKQMESLSQKAETEEEEDFSPDEDINLNEEISEDLLDEIEEDKDEAQHFSLDDLGTNFIINDEHPALDDFGMEINRLEQEVEAQEEEALEEEIQIDENDLPIIQKTLNSYPLNLKLAVETALLDENTEEPKVRILINLLRQKASARQMANQLYRLTGKRIELPKGYEKKTGIQYERKTEGFGYLFKKQTWPALRTFFIVIILAWTAFISLFSFMYRPLKARSLYLKGEELIAQDLYKEANDFFHTAFFGWDLGPITIKGWKNKKWFYRYAEAFRDRRAYPEASMKYEQLQQVYHYDYKGLYDYAVMLSQDMADYRGAETQIKRILEEDLYDYPALLLMGDNYYFWSETDPSQLENARKVYASLIDRYGNRDEVQFRMVRYFIKTKDEENISFLTDLYKSRKKINADPSFQAQIYGEWAGYLMDLGREEDAVFFLEKGKEADETIPEIHYQYARYFKSIDNPQKEEKALNRTLLNINNKESLTEREFLIKINSYKMLGDIHYRERNIDKAEKEYLTAIAEYESGRKRNLISRAPVIGELYSSTGNIYYFDRSDYDTALLYFDQARSNGYDTPEMKYRTGYIYYARKEDYEKALPYFYHAVRAFPGNRSAKYALANTLMKQKDYYAAQGIYEDILNMLQEEEESIAFLVPEEKPEHKEILVMYKEVHNNLGVSFYNISGNNAGKVWYGDALLEFTKSSEYADLLSRDPGTLTRPKQERSGEWPDASPIYRTADVAYDNRMALLYPEQEKPLFIYENIKKDIISSY